VSLAPAAARPAGGFATPGNDHDAHMTIVDQQSGWEYDLWNVQSKTGSTFNFGWGGRTRIDGNGLGSAGVAAGYLMVRAAGASPLGSPPSAPAPHTPATPAGG